MYKEGTKANPLESAIRDQKELEAFITRNSQRIYGFIFFKVRDRDVTEDIFQDTFFKAIKAFKKGKYKEEGKFMSWVIRIAHNLIMDHFRRKRCMQIFREYGDFDVFSLIQDNTPNIEKYLIKEQMETEVHEMIKKLPLAQQDVIRMRMKEMNFKEISEEMGVGINTSLGRMRYAIINLRKLAEERNLI